MFGVADELPKNAYLRTKPMSDSNPLPQISEAESNPVPVFNCIVILTKPSDDGRQTGRVANLDGVTATGFSERDILTAIVKKFKTAVQEYTAKDQPIPWIESPEKPATGEVQRYIPVHL